MKWRASDVLSAFLPLDRSGRRGAGRGTASLKRSVIRLPVVWRTRPRPACRLGLRARFHVLGPRRGTRAHEHRAGDGTTAGSTAGLASSPSSSSLSVWASASEPEELARLGGRPRDAGAGARCGLAHRPGEGVVEPQRLRVRDVRSFRARGWKQLSATEAGSSGPAGSPWPRTRIEDLSGRRGLVRRRGLLSGRDRAPERLQRWAR